MKLLVTTHNSNEEDIVEVDNYDAQALNDQRNDPDVYSILIGNYSYSRIDLKNVKPIE